MIKAIFFDALGTLFYLTRTVGHHYALAGSEVGLTLDPDQLDAAFYSAWKKMPHRAAITGPRENDDKDWWRELVDLVLDQAAPSLSEFDRDNLFEWIESSDVQITGVEHYDRETVLLCELSFEGCDINLAMSVGWNFDDAAVAHA